MCSALEEEERKERVDRATNIPWWSRKSDGGGGAKV
jgi:hypothetical protein